MAKTEENKRVERKIIESAKRGLTLGATRANTAGKAYLKTGATMGELLRAYGEAMAPIHQAEYTALTGEQLYPTKLQPAKWNNATQNYEAIDPNQPTISKAPDSYRAGTYEPKIGPQPIISAENVGEFAYDPLNWISGGTTKAAATGAKLIGRGAKRLAPEIASMAEKYALPMQMHIVPPETGRAAFLKLKAEQLDPQKEIIDAIKAKDLQAHLDAGRSLATYLPSEGLHAEIKAAIKSATPLSEKEFYKTYIAQHKDIKNVTSEDRAAAAQAILESGFNKGFNVNALPVDRGGPATDVIMKRYGNKAGDRVYLLPKEGVLEGGNGLVTAEGYKPDPMQMLDISVDREPSYEAYLRNFTKKAQGGPVHMEQGGLNINASGDYNTFDTEGSSGSHYKFNTDVDILNKYGFGITKEGQIVKLPERSYTFDDGYTVTQPSQKIKRSDISELRARYATDDGIEYGVARQPMSKGWSGYRRNMKDNSSVGVNVSPYYTGVNYTKNFAEGGEVHPEFNFEQINQYAEGGEVAHNDFNYAEIDALAQGFAKGGPVLSIGRGEKLPVSQGAGLTAKGRAKYNSATGGNLKAPAPHPKSEKDANRRKSFCARMSGMPGPMKDENGNPTRKAASLKRWNC